MLAPVAFFAYRRPLETLQSLWTLSRCPEARDSHLYIFCDGSRHARDAASIERVVEVAHVAKWCGRVTVRQAPRNIGLAESIRRGVSEVVGAHGTAVVLEDDLLVSRGFLSYMNRALERFADSSRVWQVAGHCFPALGSRPDAVVLPAITTWGWATWERAWKQFQVAPVGAGALQTDGALRHRFDLDGAYAYSSMLEAQLAGKIDSWGIRWWWTVFSAEGRSVFPRRTLVRNIGVGSAATNTSGAGDFVTRDDWEFDNQVSMIPDSDDIDFEAFEQWKTYIRAANRPPTIHDQLLRATSRIASRARETLNRLMTNQK